MQARCFSLFAFLFFLCAAVLASPVPVAQPEPASEAESDVAARAVSDLEARANSGRVSTICFVIIPQLSLSAQGYVVQPRRWQ